MIYHFPRLIGPDDARRITEAVAGESFVDGRVSSGGQAATVKRNLELSAKSETGKRLRAEIERHLWQDPTFRTIAMPRRIAGPIISQYTPGMAYGEHIDNTIMNAGSGAPIRADLSMTLFLEDPSSYDGGELVIDSDTAPQPIKLGPGDAVLYPTTGYHRVEPVTRGVRRVAVCWIQSMVRSEEQRRILTEMWIALDWLHGGTEVAADAARQHAFLTLEKARANLLRMWAEV
jgi:PKHD-type hydroxylase